MRNGTEKYNIFDFFYHDMKLKNERQANWKDNNWVGCCMTCDAINGSSNNKKINFSVCFLKSHVYKYKSNAMTFLPQYKTTSTI